MKSKAKTVKTKWEVRTFDVWGNAREGYDVNDTLRKWEVELDLEVQIANEGKESAFNHAFPSDKQIRQVLGLTNIKLETGGDDINVTVDRERDGYPLASFSCLSHSSLSPIEAKE